MPDDRRRRFLQIERPRGAGEEAPDQSPDTDARFGAVEKPGQVQPAGQPGAPASPASPAPPATPPASGHTDRFRPAVERPLEVDDLGAASQPFIRCCRCETDCSRYVARCTTCGAGLDTDEQRAFNARLWSERRAQAEAEAKDRAAHEVALDQAREDEAQARRAMAEEMAREVGQQERARLVGRDGFGWGGLGRNGSDEPTFGPPSGWGSGGTDASRLPLGFKLLALIPDPTWRVVAGVAAVALAAGLFLLKPVAGLVAGGLLVWLFMPGGWRYRRW